ncbi:MAG: protein translocase subunit SecD [Actinomycetota bacterium]
MAGRSLRGRYLTSIIVMLALVAGMWSIVAFGCSNRATPKDPLKTSCQSPMKPNLGLDLQGGISVVLAPTGKVSKESLAKAADIVRQRVDALGVAEPNVTVQGSNILVEIPGLKNREAALRLIGRTAVLRMRPVLQSITPGSPDWTKSPPADCNNPFPSETSSTAAAGTTPSATPSATASPSVTASSTKISPATLTKKTKKKKKVTAPTVNPAVAAQSNPNDDPTKPVTVCVRAKDANGNDIDQRSWEKVVLGPAALVGTDISGADALLGTGASSAGGWEVDLNLTGGGGDKFANITGKLACNPSGDVKRRLAIELDGIVESEPQMGDTVKCNVGIVGGKAQITGTFTEAQAKDLALVLRYGALPVTLVAQETNEVSATLGHESLRGGLLAGAIGLALTLIYVLIFYRILGAIVWLGLGMHAGFTLSVVIILGATVGFSLSLAGIAGLIVSIGIAADSFIVYFERIKDEVHQGKSIRASVDRAWSSAWRTIVAADLVTALAAAALYFLAVGSVRGFALMLGLATALDLFVSYLVMHPLVWLLSQTNFFNQSKRLGIKRVVGDFGPALSGGSK